VLVDWFAPGYKAGGPIQSCVNLCRALNPDYDIYVLTTDTDHSETAPYPQVTPNEWLYHEELNVKVYYAKKATVSASQLAEQIGITNADFVYLNHLFSPLFVVYPLWLTFTRKIQGKVIVCPRGALYNSALSLKSYKKKPLLALYKLSGIHKKITFHATNEREKEAITHYFPGSRIIVADNLPSARQLPFQSIKKEPGKLDCIFIARIVPIKNLLFLLHVLQHINDPILLTVVGPIENEIYWDECNKAIAALPVNVEVKYIGAKKNDELAGLIQQHHLFILPTTGENFGHAIFEALLAGRPVLISDQTPWLNLQQKNAGWDLPLSEPDRFQDAIHAAAGLNQQQFDLYANAAWQFANNFIKGSTSKEQYYTLFS